jgi:nucleoside-diphosphate kinase
MLQRTFVMLKPDAVARSLIGEMVHRIERKGLRISAMKMMRIPRSLAERHYAEHVGKKFYEPLLEYITSGPVIAMVVEGDDAVATIRLLVGKTDPKEASPGTVRFDFAMQVGRNIIHASDKPETAEREIALFFKNEEIVNYKRIDETWVYEKKE